MIPCNRFITHLAVCTLIFGASITHAAKPPKSSLPPDSQYVTVKNGHLSLNNKRVRYWGFIGGFIPGGDWKIKATHDSLTPEQCDKIIQKKYKDISFSADRMKTFGFNLYRCWTTPEDKPYFKGDGSSNDLLAYALNDFDKKGIKIWISGINGAVVSPEDVTIVNDPATAQDWQNAVKELGKNNAEVSTWCVATKWDPRLQAIGIRGKLKGADFRNQYKNNLRLADDPQNVVWELSNEEWWLRNMERGAWQKLPTFFQQSLIARWNEFLKTKYGTDANLTNAWIGLLPGESIASKTIQLLPMLTDPGVVTPNDANPAVKATLSAAAKGKYTRDDFSRQRGADVIEFLLMLQVNQKSAERAALKKHGKSCAFAPVIFDCGEGYMTQSLYLHQNADAVSIATYMTGIMNDSTDENFPWYSGLTDPPRLAWNVPWMETQRVPNKPFFVYEIGYENPGKYRAEFPYRAAQLASIQDFDILNWHTCTSGLFNADDSTFTHHQMDYTVSWDHNPQGLHYRFDEVFQSALQGAGEIFKNFLIKPAPTPTTYIFGKKTLYDPASMDYGVAYGKLGNTIMPTTYRHGTRMYCDTSRTTDSVIGPTISRGVYEPNPYIPNETILSDWRKGYMIFDAPGTATFTGFYAKHDGPVVFANGVKLDSVTVNNPPTIAYPVTTNELYIAFTLSSEDGKPLSKTKRAILSLVSTSFNSGFKIDETKLTGEYGWQFSPKATAKHGTAPVLVARAGARISAPSLNGMKYKMLNWDLKTIAEGTISNGVLIIPADKPVYITKLSR